MSVHGVLSRRGYPQDLPGWARLVSSSSSTAILGLREWPLFAWLRSNGCCCLSTRYL